MGVKYIGLGDLDQKEQSALKNIVEKEYPKIARLIKDDAELVVKIKVLKKDSRKRFILGFELDTAAKPFIVKNKETEKGGDWDIVKAAHKSMDALKTEINHRLKTDSPEWKRSGIKRFFRQIRL